MVQRILTLLLAGSVAFCGACSSDGGQSDAGDGGNADGSRPDAGDGGDRQEETDRDYTDGKLVWVRGAGASQVTWGMGIAAAGQGESVVAGIFMGDDLVFGAGEPNQTSLNSAGGHDIFVARFGEDGSLAWARRAGGADMDLGTRVVACPDGTFLVLTVIHGTCVFGPGESQETRITARGAPDLALARYAGNGDLVSAFPAAALVWDIPSLLYPCGAPVGIDVHQDGSIWLADYFVGSVTLGPGQAGETTLNGSGQKDMFLARYDSTGQLLHSAKAGGTGETFAQAVAALPDGSCVVTGGFSESVTFGRGEPGETTLASAADFDIFIARYRSDGQIAWARRAGGDESTYQWGAALAVLPDGSVVVTGDFTGLATFGPGEANQTELQATGDHSAFLARYADNGDLIWATQIDGIAHGYDVAVGEGCFTLAAKFFGTVTMGSGEERETVLSSDGGADIVVARYDYDGRLVWARRAGGTGLDLATGALVNLNGFIFSTGAFENRAVFGPGEDNQTFLRSRGDWDFFLMKLGP